MFDLEEEIAPKDESKAEVLEEGKLEKEVPEWVVDDVSKVLLDVVDVSFII